MKWNESGFRPPLCTCRLNWARRTSWGWWDDWDDTVLQTQDSKFKPWRSEAEHATSRSRRLPTILTFTRGWGRNIIVSFEPPRPGTEPGTLAWKAAVLTTTLGPPPANERKNIDLNAEQNTHIRKKICNILSFKNIYAMYKSKCHSFLRIYTSGFRKHWSDIYMANNYVSVSRLHWPCWLVYFVWLAKKTNYYCRNGTIRTPPPPAKILETIFEKIKSPIHLTYISSRVIITATGQSETNKIKSNI